MAEPAGDVASLVLGTALDVASLVLDTALDVAASGVATSLVLDTALEGDIEELEGDIEELEGDGVAGSTGWMTIACSRRTRR